MAAQSRDYYEVLGVSRIASAEELKRAYRNLAKKYHPDVNRAADATDRFKEIQEAYDILSDDAKRRQYDQFGHAGLNGNMGGNAYAGAGPFGDIFDIIFAGQATGRSGPTVVRGDDLREDLELTLEEVAAGVEKVIRFRRMETCDTCQGNGAQPGTTAETCPQCRGTGEVRYSQSTLLGTFHQSSTCQRCRGTGKIIASPCTTCRGGGRVRKARERSVKIPAGADAGMRVRLIGEGDAGERGGPSGDLYLVIYVKEHDVFERRGNDLYCEVPISIVRATLGGTVKVPVINGTEELKVPEGTQPGQVFTLRAKGIPDVNGRGKGDEHVVIKVEIPTKLTHEQRELLRQFAATTEEGAPEQHEGKGLFGRILGHHS